MKVLVVEDDDMMLNSISHCLATEGFDVIKANDGMKALEILEKEELDLIISDIMMPNMSGLGLLSLLKKFYFNRIPVILISSLDKGDVILSSLDLGAHDFIVKPVNFDELVLRVKKILKK